MFMMESDGSTPWSWISTCKKLELILLDDNILLWRGLLAAGRALDKGSIALQRYRPPPRRLAQFAHIHSGVQAGFPTFVRPSSPLLLRHGVMNLGRRFALQRHEPGPGRLQRGDFRKFCQGMHRVSAAHNLIKRSRDRNGLLEVEVGPGAAGGRILWKFEFRSFCLAVRVGGSVRPSLGVAVFAQQLRNAAAHRSRSRQGRWSASLRLLRLILQLEERRSVKDGDGLVVEKQVLHQRVRNSDVLCRFLHKCQIVQAGRVELQVAALHRDRHSAGVGDDIAAVCCNNRGIVPPSSERLVHFVWTMWGVQWRHIKDFVITRGRGLVFFGHWLESRFSFAQRLSADKTEDFAPTVLDLKKIKKQLKQAFLNLCVLCVTPT